MSEKEAYIGFRTWPLMKVWLETKAKKEDASITDVMNMILTDAFNQEFEEEDNLVHKWVDMKREYPELCEKYSLPIKDEYTLYDVMELKYGKEDEK